jgi:hypothetical protein
MNRREMLRQGPLGFGAAALASLLADDGLFRAAENPAQVAAAGMVRPMGRRAKSVIFIFLGGGPGQVDTLDPKPELTRLHGQDVPESIAAGVPRIARAPLVNLLASPWNFRRCGQSGTEISDLFPHLRRMADDLCVLRSCRHDSPIHAPAEFLTMTGTLQGDRPSLGAWLTYGLGSASRDLPGYVVFKTGETVRPPALAAGFLPARYQGTQVDLDTGIPHLAQPAEISRGERRAQLDFLAQLNRRHLASHPEISELEARIESYELGFRMQAAAPEAFDLSRETEATHRLYGVGTKETDEYGRIFLTTRRLVERGVRFVQIRSGGWDAHSDLLKNHGEKCLASDQPLAALLADLKQRGLLGETLVVWGGEFGRTPTAQGGAEKPGRDHSPSGYSMWLAGGGVRGGQVIGATDPVGYAAVERPIHPNDLHATILQALGIDQRRLYYEHHNRREIVTVNGGRVVEEVFG